MITINLKAISVNEAWKGRRFSTKKKTAFEKKMASELQYLVLEGEPPYRVDFRFHIPKMQDLDNCIKVVLDCMMKHFGINDRDVYKIVADKVIAKKGEEKFEFEIESLDYPQNKPIITLGQK